MATFNPAIVLRMALSGFFSILFKLFGPKIGRPPLDTDSEEI